MVKEAILESINCFFPDGKCFALEFKMLSINFMHYNGLLNLFNIFFPFGNDCLTLLKCLACSLRLSQCTLPWFNEMFAMYLTKNTYKINLIFTGCLKVFLKLALYKYAV